MNIEIGGRRRRWIGRQTARSTVAAVAATGPKGVGGATLDALLDGICIAPEGEPPRTPARRRARRVH